MKTGIRSNEGMLKSIFVYIWFAHPLHNLFCVLEVDCNFKFQQCQYGIITTVWHHLRAWRLLPWGLLPAQFTGVGKHRKQESGAPGILPYESMVRATFPSEPLFASTAVITFSRCAERCFFPLLHLVIQDSLFYRAFIVVIFFRAVRNYLILPHHSN